MCPLRPESFEKYAYHEKAIGAKKRKAVMALRKRNVLLGGLLAAVIIGSSSLSASAADWNEGAENIATQSGGELSLTVDQYSMQTVHVKAYYSDFIYPDTVIDITAKDKATGKVVSTARIDNDTWVQERVLSGFSYKHTYAFTASLSWKDGSHEAVSTREAVNQKINFTDQIKTMTFKTLNKDVPVTSTNGTIYRAQIKYSEQTDTAVFKLPTVSNIKAKKLSKSSRLITWGAAKTNGGYPVSAYTAKVLLNGKVVASKSISASGKRQLTVKNLKWGSYQIQIDAKNISGNHKVSYTDFLVY